MSCAQAHWVGPKPIRRVMKVKLHKPTMAIGYSLRACAHDMLIPPIQVEVTLYLGQNRYRKPRCRIGLLEVHFCVKKVQETLISIVKSIILHCGKNLGCKMLWSEICQKCPLDNRKCVGIWGFPSLPDPTRELTALPRPISWKGMGVAPLP